MADDVSNRIEKLMADATRDTAAKIKTLRQWEADARARERASTEGMVSPEKVEGAELKAIEAALARLGEPAADPGASSL